VANLLAAELQLRQQVLDWCFLAQAASCTDDACLD
jgi:hypothetical protein